MPKNSPRQKINKYANLRPSENKESKRFIVIIVEGARTEPNYFAAVQQNFRDIVKLEVISPNEGESSPTHLLKSVLEKKIDYERSSSKPDSFWLVCDTDEHPNLQSIIKNAKEWGFGVVISNPCFEVWLFSHFGKILIGKDSVEFCDLKEKRLLKVPNNKNYDRKLSKKIANILGTLREDFKGSGYDVYMEKISEAISRAEQNLKKVRADNLLVGSKYIGQTRVGNLMTEIINWK